MEGKKTFININIFYIFLIRLNWTFELLLSTVGKLHIVVIVWSFMTLFTSFVVFYGTYIWAINRKLAASYLSKIKAYNKIKE